MAYTDTNLTSQMIIKCSEEEKDSLDLSQIPDGSFVVTEEDDGGSTPENMVTTDTDQEITGIKMITTTTDTALKVARKSLNSGAFIEFWNTFFEGEESLIGAIGFSGINGVRPLWKQGESSTVELALLSDIRDKAYPVGAIFLSTISTSPASYLGGTWEELPSGNALWTTATSSADAGKPIAAGLPNITGQIDMRPTREGETFTNASGMITANEGGSSTKWSNGHSLGSTGKYLTRITLDASSGSSTPGIYGNSTTVQPPAYKIYAWKRVP